MRQFLVAFLVFLFALLTFGTPTEARRGCCSPYGGVCGCTCCDGKPLSAKCAPYYPDCDKTKVKAPKQKAKSKKKPDGYVVSVVDGDTIHAMMNGKRTKIRLYGIDCPEIGQPWSKSAKGFVSKKTRNQTTTIIDKGKDSYGRVLR